MKDILNELLTDIMMLGEETKHTPGQVWRTRGGFGAMNQVGNTDYFKDKKAADLFAKGREIKKPKIKKPKTKQSKQQSTVQKPTSKKPDTTVKPSVPSTSFTIPVPKNLPGAKGVLDAIVGVTEKGSAGAGIPESRAAEASVVLISNQIGRAHV